MPTLTARGCEIAYDVLSHGERPPLVWGHGLSGSRGIDAAYPLLELSPRQLGRQLVRYDARGHGLSSPLDDVTKGSWAELALDQIALVDHLNITTVALGGASMGAATALHAALSLGNRVSRLVLVIPPTGWSERAAQVAMYEQMATIIETRGPKTLLASSAAIAPPDPFVGTSQWADRRAGNLGGADATRLAANYRGAAHADLPSLEMLEQIVAPSLVLAWSGDPSHPVSTAEQLGETLPNVDVSIASTAADFANWGDQVLEFLADG